MYAFDDGDGVVGVLMKERGEAIVANPARSPPCRPTLPTEP
jgi:hypothetical protein